MITLLFQLCIFGVDMFGGTGCEIDRQIQEIEEFRLELQLKYFDLTMDDYVGDGCLQTTFEYETRGISVASQGWYDGIYRHHLNGTQYTETYCSWDVWDVFEDNQSLDYYKSVSDGNFAVDFYKEEVYYDGEWLRLEPEHCSNIEWKEVDRETYRGSDQHHKKEYLDGMQQFYLGVCQ